jgi:hypothetical protein
MKKRQLITYLANPYDMRRDSPKKGTALTKDGRIWKNDLMKFDMTSQRGNK